MTARVARWLMIACGASWLVGGAVMVYFNEQVHPVHVSDTWVVTWLSVTALTCPAAMWLVRNEQGDRAHAPRLAISMGIIMAAPFVAATLWWAPPIWLFLATLAIWYWLVRPNNRSVREIAAEKHGTPIRDRRPDDPPQTHQRGR